MSMTGVMDIVWHEKKPDRILFQGKVRLAQLRGAVVRAVVRGASRRSRHGSQGTAGRQPTRAASFAWQAEPTTVEAQCPVAAAALTPPA